MPGLVDFMSGWYIKEKKSLKKVVKVTSLVQYQLHTELI